MSVKTLMTKLKISEKRLNSKAFER